LDKAGLKYSILFWIVCGTDFLNGFWVDRAQLVIF